MTKIVLFTALTLLLVSCEKDNKKLLDLDISFTIINYNVNRDINELKLQNNKLVNKVKFNVVNDLNNSSIAYFNYLDSIQSLCKDNQTPFFFKGERSESTKLSIDFIEKTNVFLNKLNDEIKNPTLRKRMYLLLNVDDIELDEQSSIMYIESYFRNVSCEAFDFFINDRKRNVLIIQNQILYESLLNQ